MKDKVTPEFLSGLCEERAEVLAGYLLSDEEKEKFRDFATIFCDVINTDRQEGISDLLSRFSYNSSSASFLSNRKELNRRYIIDKDRQGGISEAECGVFAQVLEFSGITSK